MYGIAVHGDYNIYYRFIGETAHDVLVIRVMHGARDIGQEEMG